MLWMSAEVEYLESSVVARTGAVIVLVCWSDEVNDVVQV